MALYEARAEAILGFFARRTLDAQVAADLTSETFSQALASRGRFDSSRGEPVAWLFGIARHQLGRYLRTLRVDRDARAALRIPERSLDEADLDRIEALIDLTEVGRRMQSALADLAPDQREAVVLRVIDELGYDEIARRQGVSEAAVRSRVSRALRTLAVSLGGEDDDLFGAAQ